MRVGKSAAAERRTLCEAEAPEVTQCSKINVQLPRLEVRSGRHLAALIALAISAIAPLARSGEFPPPFDTQAVKDAGPLSPEAAAAAIKLPPGFRASVFAAEPDVRQPVGMATDARGRLWVAECYTYAESKVDFDLRLRDRIVIFEDSKKSGHFDKRTVFWDQGERLTSVAPGFGGVFVLCPPQLLFIPDKNGDDVPDSEPQVLLDGFTPTKGNRHTLANGLDWGPDGWLYGRVGISSPGRVGRPGAPEAKRTRINGGIWRYHPTEHRFEVVGEGTTNPWGLDWNAEGEGFFTNTVIGHLWHLTPGAHYRRMHGEDTNPFAFQFMDQCADHYHWDTGANWTKSRAIENQVAPTSDTLGGGHAHCGCVIYQGDQFPAAYRGKLLTLNLHGRRINVDRLERNGSGYVGQHEPDFGQFGDPWFRGVAMIQAPDGGLFVADWSDTGECHDNDGVHRTSGRIFKITYDGGKAVPSTSALPADVNALRNDELVALQLSTNEWLVRTARRVLRERAAAKVPMDDAVSALTALIERESDPLRKLRGMWALNGVLSETPNGLELGDPTFAKLATEKNEHVRAWALQLWGPRLIEVREKLAQNDPSALVRRWIASQLMHSSHSPKTLAVLHRLLAHGEDATDPVLPLLLWYATTGLSPDPASLASCEIPLVRRFTARRAALALSKNPDACNEVVSIAANSASAGLQRDVLLGIGDALNGWRKAPKPKDWPAFEAKIAALGLPELNAAMLDLNVVFGDGRALDTVRKIALDSTADFAVRRRALDALIDSRLPDLRATCEQLLPIREMAPVAVRGLKLFDDPTVATLLLKQYGSFNADDRPDVISTLIARAPFAKLLLDAVASGKIPRTDITAFHARQMRNLEDPGLNRQLSEVWGEVRETSEARQKLVSQLKAQITPEALRQADLRSGRALFNQACAVCHTLYGEGGKIGPDLTGGARGNLAYLLDNISDPSAIVPADFRLTVLTLKDGRVLSGIVGGKNERSLVLHGMTETQNFELGEIERMETLPQSLMPEGLLDSLDQTQRRDLIAYLMSKAQVPLK